MAVSGDEIIPTEFFLQGLGQGPSVLNQSNANRPVERPREAIYSGASGAPWVAAEHDQGLVQPDFFIDEFKQVGQGPIQTQDVVFGLQAGGPEQVADVVG